MSGHGIALCVTDAAQAYVPAWTAAMTVRAQRVDLVLMGRVRADLVLIAPIVLEVELDTNGWYVAACDDFPLHGVGENVDEAVRDYLDCLVDYHNVVAASAAQGNADDLEELARLRSFISTLENHHATQAG